MAVHTELSKANINEILENYQLGELKSFKGIKEGIENTNYLLLTKQNKFILTLFEKRVDTSKIPFYFQVMINSQKLGIECPIPIRDKKGKFINIIKEKKMAIFSFLEGKSKKNWNELDCLQVGKKLAKFHLVNKNNKNGIRNNFGLDYWKKIFSKSSINFEKIIPNSYKIIKNEINFVSLNWPKSLPKSVIHADLFPDNVFFKENKISGFLDFYFSCCDYLSYDLAITINAWCFYKNKFNKDFFLNLVSGYQSIRKLDSRETDNFNILLRGAALRFLLTRIYDTTNIGESKFLKKKDPLEFYSILNFHLKINSKDFYFD